MKNREIKSMMEERAKSFPKLIQNEKPNYSKLTTLELNREKLLIRRELERIAEHTKSLEQHLDRLRSYQEDLFLRKDSIERLMVPVLKIKPKKEKKQTESSPNSQITQILSNHSLTDIEAILEKAKVNGRI